MAVGGEPARDPWPCAVRARLHRAVASVAGREDYVRVRLFERDGETWAEPLPGGSSAISNLVYADGMVRVDAARTEVPAGEWGRRLDVRRRQNRKLRLGPHEIERSVRIGTTPSEAKSGSPRRWRRRWLKSRAEVNESTRP